MNNKAVTISLIMAVLAVFIVQSYISSIEQSAEERYGTQILVLTAKRNIKEMEGINETMLELTRIPKRFLDPAAISFRTSEKDDAVIRNMKGLTGSVAIVPIKEGEQITYNKIREPGLRTGLSPQVTPGRRAVAVPVNEITGVAKLVKPGDRVDVLATLDMGSGKTGKLVKTILQDVAVLAVGRSVTNNIPRVIERTPGSKRERVRSLSSYDGFTSVTLEVEPSQAQRLVLLSSLGNQTVTLALRNNDDTDRVKTPSLSVWELLGDDAAKARSLLKLQRRRQ